MLNLVCSLNWASDVCAYPAFSKLQAWKMAEMGCELLILIFKVFNYIVSGMDIILSLKCDCMFCPSPESVIVRFKACLPLVLNVSPLITNVGEPVL